MSDMTPTISRLALLPIAELRAELKLCGVITAGAITMFASVVAEFDRRGEETGVHPGLLAQLRRIATGHLLANFVARFQGTEIMRRAQSFPRAEQEALASGGPIKVVVRADGAFTHRLMEPGMLRRQQINQVFAATHVRDEREQIAYLEEEDAARRAAVVPEEQSIRLAVALDPDELRALEKRARLAGLSLEAFARRCLIGTTKSAWQRCVGASL